MFDLRMLRFDLSNLISSYNKLVVSEFKTIFKKFVNNYYFYAIEQIDLELDKQNIIIYSEIIHTYNIFKTLLSFEDDYDIIIKAFSTRKAYSSMLKILYENKYISHTDLALKLQKSSQALTDFIKKLPQFGLFAKIEEKGSIYTLTKKGVLFWEKYIKQENLDNFLKLNSKFVIRWLEDEGMKSEIRTYELEEESISKNIGIFRFAKNSNSYKYIEGGY